MLGPVSAPQTPGVEEPADAMPDTPGAVASVGVVEAERPAPAPGVPYVADPPGGDQAPGAAPAFRPAPDALLPTGLSLRLTLRARPTALLPRLVLAAAGAGTGYLLLAALALAVPHATHPAHPAIALARLVWCAVPLAAVALLAVTVVGTRTRATVAPAFAVVGSGPARLPLLAAAEAALVLVPGSAAAFGVFTGTGHRPAPLPDGAVVTLLALVPLVCAAACAIALWPRGAGRTRAIAGPATGLVAIACGLAIALYAHGPAHPVHRTVPLPGGLGRIAPLALTGWALVVAGQALLGPGLTYLTGRVVACWRPGAVRLLAGRALQADAGLVGLPLGALSAALCAGVSAVALRGAGSPSPGPLTLLAATITLAAPAVALLRATAHARHTRSGGTDVLYVLGASPALLRSGALLRAAAVLTVFLPVTAAFCWLSAPLRG